MSYSDSLLALVGARDPLDVQAELAGWIEQRTASLDDATLRRPEAPGKWSVIEVVQHLADTELAYGYRVRMILTHDAWPVEVFDREAWSRELRYQDAPLAGALEQLRALRSANLRLYRSLTSAQLALAWVLSRGEHVHVIPGTTRLAHTPFYPGSGGTGRKSRAGQTRAAEVGGDVAPP